MMTSNELDACLHALSSPLLREILMWLKDPRQVFPEQTYGQDFGVCAGQISLRAEQTRSAILRHLDILRSAGLIERRKIGSAHFFKRHADAMDRFKKAIALMLE